MGASFHGEKHCTYQKKLLKSNPVFIMFIINHMTRGQICCMKDTCPTKDKPALHFHVVYFNLPPS